MKKRLLSLFLVFVMLLGLLPQTVLAANETSVNDFFDDLSGIATATNDAAYPFAVDTATADGPWLKSTNETQGSTSPAITLTFQQAATLTFDYVISSESTYDGMLVKNGTAELYTYAGYSSSGAVTYCSGEASGTATVEANEGDVVTIAYRKDGSGNQESDCMWLKNFSCALPAQVIFHANHGTGDTVSQGIFGKGYLADNPFDYDGYIFKGWATTATGDVDYADGDSITIDGDTHLYAVWAPVYGLTFTVTPSDAEFALYRDDAYQTRITPDSKNGTTYTMERGTYYWNASQFGYTDDHGSVTVYNTAMDTEVTLVQNDAVAVTFAYADGVDDVDGGTLVVTTDEQSMRPTEAGGMTYALPTGYTYRWTFSSKNYARQTGALDLSNTAGSGTQNVTIPMGAKPAWEGAEDISVPCTDSDGTYLISSGSELAWLAQEVNGKTGTNYNARLTADIDLGGEDWTPIGKTSSNQYTGVFDGQDFHITGLYVTGTAAGNYGLLGYVDGGTIRNLNVAGNIHVTGGGSSNGTGGLVGQFSGSSGTIENCLSNVTVSGVQNVGGLVGYVSSGNSSATKVIQGCINLGAVASSGTDAGGLVGKISGQVSLRDSYNRGDVTGGSWRAGGITAYLTSSNATIENCYTTGNVTAKGDFGAGIGKRDSGSASGCYYLSTTGTDTAGTMAKTQAEMQSGDFVTLLAIPFQKDMATAINDGYPILIWQDTTPKYNVTVTAVPKDAAVTLRDSAGDRMNAASVVDGVHTYRLIDGTYRYTAEAFGYCSVSGSIAVNAAAMSESILLPAADKQTVRFAISPEAASALANIQLTYGGVAMTAAADGSYTLPSGDYDYIIKAKGYGKVVGTLTVDAATSLQTVPLTMEISTGWDGEELETPSQGNGTETAPYEIENGAQLAWYANQINASSSNSGLCGLLTADIDLGDGLWTPIGKSSSYKFSGVFDGAGHTVSGLNVTVDTGYAGLFGYVKGASSSSCAELKNFTVEGSVTNISGYTGYAAGIVGYASYANLTNCHNRADVTSAGGNFVGGVTGIVSHGGAVKNSSNTGAITATNSNYVGGIIGQISIFVYGTSPVFVSQCYNSGDVRGKGFVGGVIGNLDGDTQDVYNTGNVCGTVYVGGIAGEQKATVEHAYTTGTVSGTTASAAFGKVSTSSSYPRTNILYLDTLIPDANATPVSSSALRGTDYYQTLGTNWQDNSQGTTNNNYPLLSWQEVIIEDIPAEKLATPHVSWKIADGYETEPNPPVDAIAQWAGAEDAVGYELTLVQGKMALDDQDMTYTSILSVSVDAEDDVTDYSYDFKQAFDDGIYESTTIPQGWYYLQITAIADTQDQYADSLQSKIDTISPRYTYISMAPATDLRWDGSTATWGAVDFACAYIVNIYRLPSEYDTDGALSSVGGVQVWGDTQLSCHGLLSAGGKYIFQVTALSVEYALGGIVDPGFAGVDKGDDTLTDEEIWLAAGLISISDYSNAPTEGGTTHGVYSPDTAITEPDEWELITTAEQFIDLANVEDIRIDATTNKQDVAWSKNYKLANDIDFSTLSDEYTLKTKSIGTYAHPFSGVFDGDGHTITGLTLSNGDGGLFSYIGSTGAVRNVTIEGANVLFSDNAGVLAYANRGIVKNCAVINTNITADIGAVLGGMVSRNYGVIEDSYVLGGTLTSNTGYATGHGGFVGANDTGGTIKRCYSTMDVNTQSKYAGGFVGLCYGGEIVDCFATGDVSAREHSGGFAGSIVFDGNVFYNCYASNTVAVQEEGTGYGFVSTRTSDSLFQYDLSKETFTNCFYNSDLTATDTSGALVISKDTAGMEGLTETLGANWSQDDDKNNALPYLTALPAPESMVSSDITVYIMTAIYDKGSYHFTQYSEPVEVTFPSTGNSRVMDAMDAAVEQGLLTYTYDNTTEFGRYIKTINDYSVTPPDGWMFTVNDVPSKLSASIATVEHTNQILWFEGTTENLFSGPTWAEVVSGVTTQWIDIATVDDLLSLLEPGADLSQHYRLTANIDLKGTAFAGIGTAMAPFTGVFDGQNFTVNNLTMDGTTNVGFFGAIQGATIKNLNLENAQVSGAEHVGALVGHAMVVLDTGDLSQNKANLIGSCTVSGAVSGTKHVGGLVGTNGGKTDSKTLFSIFSAIDKCSADVTVEGVGQNTTTGYHIGGLVGQNDGYITNSAAAGNVVADNSAMVGGFCGSASGSVYGSYALGEVIGSTGVGGLLGSGSGTVEDCYSLGAVAGSGDNIGGFAGSFSGSVKGSMSAGTVTPGNSYNGGFIGSFSGNLVGLDNQITLKDSYGNCALPGGASLNPIGNASKFPGDTNKAALAEIQLDTLTETADKLWEQFGVSMSIASLAAEGDQYLDSLTIPASTPVGDLISLLKAGATPSGAVTATLTVNDPTGSLSVGASGLTLTAKYTGTGTATASVTLCLTNDDGHYYKTISVNLMPETAQAEDLMHQIAATYVDSYGEWNILDMAAYAALNPSAASKTSETALQSYINYAIGTVADDTTGGASAASTYGKAEIILRAIGGDTTKLYPVNSNTPLNNAQQLSALTISNQYDAPWVLLAHLQGNTTLSNAQIEALIQRIGDAQGEDGLFSYTFDGVTYPDIDTAGTVLAALSAYYDSHPGATAIVDKTLDSLSSAQAGTGSYGNANSDAMVIVGLAALGIDPATDARFVKNGVSLVDGLLSYANEGGTGFTFYGTDNALATEQGFRALIAAAQVAANGGQGFNVYDYSQNTVGPLRATGTGQVVDPSDPIGTTNITVSFTLETDDEVWIPRTTLTLKDDATVYHALIKALGTSFTQVGASRGYVRSITNVATGETLGEFDSSKNSGWLYKVNDIAPDVGLTSYKLESGDAIVWYYTDDYSKEPGAGGWAVAPETAVDQVIDLIDAIGTVTPQSAQAIKTARDAYDELTNAQKRLVTNYDVLTAAEAAYSALENGLPFTDIADHWALAAIQYVYEHDLMSGTGENKFDPNGTLNRAMLVTILYHMEGNPEFVSANPFSDVGANLWYTDGVIWANENEIIFGYGDGLFGPNDSITREQLAVILYGYAKYKGYDTARANDLTAYADAQNISNWALEAMQWANGEGFLTGRTATTIVPGATANRAEAATILMHFVKNIPA